MNLFRNVRRSGAVSVRAHGQAPTDPPVRSAPDPSGTTSSPDTDGQRAALPTAAEPSPASFTRLDVQLAEARNIFGAGLSAEGLRLSQLSRPSRARAYARAAQVRFQSGEWCP